MSRTLRIDRSNAKSATLKRWITEGIFYPGDAVCEVVIDGTSEIVKWDTTYHNDIAGVTWAYVREGDEIGQDGSLLEYSTSGGGRDPRNTFIGDEQVRSSVVSGWTPSPTSLGYSSGGQAVADAVVEEFEQLKEDIDQVARDRTARIDRLRESISRVSDTQWLRFLQNRLSPDAHNLLKESSKFRSRFLAEADCHAFVMSVDIRRSTELMLKARTPEHFANFTTALCKDLMRIIVSSYGVFDKFTGDGILAFFPAFFSGPDAAYRVVDAAAKCHESFEKHYLNFRRSFKAILKDTGLGIGIDYGPVRMVAMADGLTVVGEPVVYACRLSSAPAGKTLLNQSAYELVSKKCGAFCQISETELMIKHEERLLTYDITLAADHAHVPAPPEWLKSVMPAKQR